MSDTNTGAAPAAPANAEPRRFRVTLGRSVRFRDVTLNPRHPLTVTEDMLAELGDAVLEKVEINGTEV